MEPAAEAAGNPTQDIMQSEVPPYKTEDISLDHTGEECNEPESNDQRTSTYVPPTSGHNPDSELLREMQARIMALEKRIEKPDKAPQDRTSDQKRSSKHLRCIPELKRVEWSAFKNKVVGDQRVCAIEILAGDAQYYNQRKSHIDVRLRRPANNTASERTSQESSTSLDSNLPERIRINSKPLLKILGQIDSEAAWTPGPIVVRRPFKPFIHFESEIREVYQNLESKWSAMEEAQKSNGTQHSSQAQEGVDDQGTLEDVDTRAVPMLAKGVERNGKDPNTLGSLTEVETQHHLDGKPSGDSVLATGPQETEQQVTDSIDHGFDFVANKEDDKGGPGSGDLTDCVEALRDLRCLIKFMDDELMPVSNRFKNLSNQKVAFSELWHLFKPGDILYAPKGNRSDVGVADFIGRGNDKDSRIVRRPVDRFHEAWRISSTSSGREYLSPSQIDDPTDFTIDDKNHFYVVAHNIELTGSKYEAQSYLFWVNKFEGRRDITSLNFYPFQYASNPEKLRSKWREVGKVVKTFTSFKQLHFAGRSLACHPNGDRPDADRLPIHSENIDSQVVVDFIETLAENPGWRTSGYYCPEWPVSNSEFKEDYPTSYWKDAGQLEIDYEENDRIYYDRRVDLERSEMERNSDGLVADRPERNLYEDGTLELSDDHLILFPNRVFAFIMKNRKFAMLPVDGLRPIKSYVNGFDDLKLPDGHKPMVRSLVYNHFASKAADSIDIHAGHDSDLVRGKGKGLIVLLHGAPGVGKTSTAECVAEASGKLLFPITCGDLGTTAADVEWELSNKFHLAELWDCVLLLDEADVFLAQRSKTDIRRNSLVSVFLRVLEYFTGILFLTTNRVGSFDEAFKSRIHISLYYPPLGLKQTNNIWRMNMDRLKERRERREQPIRMDEAQIYAYAEKHFRATAVKKANWNGRQIRNAFQTATALAEFEANQKHEAAKKLGLDPAPMITELRVEHFDRVAWASFQFDKYLTHTRGGFTDAKRAFQDEQRSDDFRQESGSLLVGGHQPATTAFAGPPPNHSRPQQPRIQRQQMVQSNPVPTFAASQDYTYDEEDDEGLYDPSWQDSAAWPTSAMVSPRASERMEDPTRLGGGRRQQHVEQASILRRSVMEYDDVNDY